ncbi:tetratricopeptide repeat protein [Fodinibius salsisoli]|uniref:Tetratricopeptide repeat protein n=1 Tax=Fodinibius salsisoli TaxID=2820877 RepID=A0ABT3PMZ3_9BACT|nr:tetratricopeptide repeat protein [Fodinibius salsisoli]MCW9707331.1 tetratricopeptide repeat protein [Fodinibius salsisoli]
MKFFKNSLTTLLVGLFIVGLTTNVKAQDKREAIKTYNQALELMKANEFEQAANMFTQAIAQAEELGEEGNDIVERSQGQLPGVYFSMAKQEYRNFQSAKSMSSLEATIDAFGEAGEVADEYGNSQIADKVPNILTQLTYTKSLLQYQQQSFDQALATLDQVIEDNPNYAKAYYQKGIITKKMDSGSLDDALGFFDKAIELGTQNNNNQIVARAQSAAADELVYRGSQANQNNSYSEAITLLNRALEYDDASSDAYFRLAEAYNGQQNWQQAVSAANKALELSNGGRTDKAKTYFALGTAYQGLGQSSDACDAFTNAAYGTFKSSAEHKMEYELKCGS